MLKLSHPTLVTLLTLTPCVSLAQYKPDLAGDFLGALGPLHLKLQRNAKTYYVYADPAHNQIYVGGQFQYDQYRDLRLAKNLAQEDLQDARLNAEPAMGWEVWGPFY